MPNRIFIAKLIALGAAVVSIQQAAAGALDWEIERNFRYFKFSPDIAVHRIAFDLFKAEFKKTPSIDGLERYINDPGFWKKNLVSADAERNSWPKAWRANNLKTPYALIAKLRGLENDRAAVPDASELERLGWASLLVRAQDKSHPNGQTDTCWSTIRRQHTNCTEYGDYVRPQGWVVRIFDKDAAPGSKCAWRGDGGTIIDRLSEAELYGKDGSIKVALNVPWQSRPDRDCDELRVFVPAEPQEPHKVIGSVHVVRIAADNTEAPLTLSPQDLLIVGFGDSFGSGEGNPERGATFDEYLAIRDLLLRARRSPDADYPHDRAQWTDRWCHRSVYSWQIRTGLHLALIDKHRSITILPYGCSGAEIFEGFLYDYDGVEYTPKTRNRVTGHPAQLGLAYQELCKTYYKNDKAPKIQPDWQDDIHLTRAARAGAKLEFSDARKAQILNYVQSNITRCEKSGPNQFQFKRDVSLVFLIGGINDIGFSRWVTAAISEKWIAKMVGAFIPKASDPETELRLSRLKFRYDIFRDALDKRFLWMRA